MIARDEKRLVVASMCETFQAISDPTIAEAVAAWKAVAFSCELGFPQLILEGDTLEIVLFLQQEGPYLSRYGQLLEDSNARLNGLQFWTINHVHRDRC